MTPQVDCAQLDGDDPNTSRADAGIISEPWVDKLSAENLGQVNGLSRRLLDLGPPVRNLPAKLCKYPGPVLTSLCPVALDVVEVCYRYWHRKVQGSKITKQVLQIFPDDTTFCGRNIQKVKELLELPFWEGYFACLHVKHHPKDFLDTGPVSLPCQELLETHQVIFILGQGQEETLEGSEGSVEYLALSFGPALRRRMGEYLHGEWWSWPCLWDIGYGAIPRHQKQRDDNCIGHIHNHI